MSVLELRNISKSYGHTQALDGVSFDLNAGEIVALLGPSGSGKSTLLQVIAGLEKQDRGEVLWEGRSLENSPPHRRGFGLMFQDYALFPHMDVFDNIAFGLRMAGMDAQLIQQRVAGSLGLVGLSGFDRRDVNTLSGGEQQRVALARAIAPEPQLLMLDEPLGSVDRTLRERLMDDLRRILKQLHQTALYVTHDQEEAFAVSDRVILLRAGRIEQSGMPESIYRQPNSLFVARFLGLANFFPGQVISQDGHKVAVTQIGSLPAESGQPGATTVLVRPDMARLDGSGSFVLSGKVIDKDFRGSLCRLVVDINGAPVEFEFPFNQELPAQGQEVSLSFDPRQAFQLFSA